MSAEVYGTKGGGWRARKGAYVRGGYRLEHVIQQVREHEAWEAEQTMTLTRLDKAPFPWAGGKADAAPLVWEALGDVDHYAEPFCGSLVTLLRRPHAANRTYHSETVNDADGYLVNAFRSIQHSPEATAAAARGR